MMTDDFVPATLLPRELGQLNQTGLPVPGYHRLGALMVRRENLPEIARHLGLLHGKQHEAA